MNSSIAIFDLDNCVANDEWRIPRIRFDLPNELDEKWDTYHSLCYGDNPGNQRLVQEALSQGVKLAFITMRPEKYREMTDKWIQKRLLHVWPAMGFVLLMRPDGDHRPSVELKRSIARELMREHTVVAAFDDRPDIVDMYRSLGIPRAQVLKIHDIDPHTGKRSRHIPAPPAIPDREGAAPAGEGEGGGRMPDAPPTRGEGPARTLPGAFPFTTDPLASFERTTGGNSGRRADDFLTEATEMWRSKNAAYGDHYRRFGELAALLFPKGLLIETPGDWNRLAVFIHVMTKVSRYAECLPMEGHADSALDLAVYAAMLRELTPA